MASIPPAFAEAVSFIKDRPAVTQEVFRGLLPELRMRAFTVGRLTEIDQIVKVQEVLARLPAGGDHAALKEELKTLLTEKWGGQAERQAELLLRLHGGTAYSAAQYRQLRAQADLFPYWQYVTHEDERVRSTHAALHGLVIPAGSAFWRWHFPPWEWNCRCRVVGLMQYRVDQLKEEDKARPEGQRLVFDEDNPDTAALLERGLLFRGKNAADRALPKNLFNVQSRSERGDEDGFEWEPGTLTLPLDKLKERYVGKGHTAAWEAFESWAKVTTPEGTGQTVWSWLDKSSKSEVRSPKLDRSDLTDIDEAPPGAWIVPATEATPELASGQAYLAPLVQARPRRLGGGAGSLFLGEGWEGPLAKKAVAEHAQDFLSIVPPEMLKKAKPLLWKVDGDLVAPGSHSVVNGNAVIRLKPDEALTPAGLRRLVWHEMAHWLDDADRLLHLAMRAHFKKKTAGLQLEKKVLADGREIAFYPNVFIDDYAARVYPGRMGGNEILPVYMAAMSDQRRLSLALDGKLDPETFDLIREHLSRK